ncbi:response regulator [Sphingomonas sp. R647]|jgi:two-component system response regulator FixJ|uniref:response regulator FixJ n=1 Tax=Sphingomonas sp. R647 TaxID=2875233 RepID=UPI001CD2FCA6|nr:response regulator FixJ [Sphingomonas sp. R647]MCA1199240.1 response regulator [Sphingomonas sp. R647]
MPAEPVVHIVDDDEGVRSSLSFLLECSDLTTRTYESAVEFLKAVPTMARGCIITDVRMPQVSGMELVARLKDLGVGDPVIVITGHADVPMAIAALRQGVADFIEKPFSDEAILLAVRSALAKQQSRGEVEIERDAIQQRLATLSGREREVMDGLILGKANKVIAFDLDISARTVEVYRANVMTKMRARTLSELVRMAMIAQLG